MSALKPRPNWHTAKHWVFDMDGTLTVAVHDFAYMRQTLGAPSGVDLISFVNSLPEAEALARMAQLSDYEAQLAHEARAGAGVAALLDYLTQQGATLGVLTRNRKDLALITLEAAGLAGFFLEEHVLGRDDAAPKPSADGLIRLASDWGVSSAELVMVGDYHYDLDCARNAGAYAILLNPENLWPERCHAYVSDANALLRALS